MDLPFFTVIWALEQLPSSQVGEWYYSHKTHQDQGEDVPVTPVRAPPKLWNASEVHAIYARNQRRGQEYGGHNGEDSYDLVG